MNYSQFLEKFCECYADDNGNRPCDNGWLCDRCMTDEMQELWEEVKRHVD